jgi:hypothetical protein
LNAAQLEVSENFAAKYRRQVKNPGGSVIRGVPPPPPRSFAGRELTSRVPRPPIEVDRGRAIFLCASQIEDGDDTARPIN